MPLSEAQHRHVRTVADALVMCETEKTLAALHRQWVDGVDPSNLADFFRISPWQASDLRSCLQGFLVRWAVEQAQQSQSRPVIRISLDDSLAAKGKATRHLEPVDWH